MRTTWSQAISLSQATHSARVAAWQAGCSMDTVQATGLKVTMSGYSRQRIQQENLLRTCEGLVTEAQSCRLGADRACLQLCKIMRAVSMPI
mmetsp:Transcript_150171/g.280067  ORF Transcript_150171/g.280067 Transcript_150171/m.280067 type:complete len:91 (-) Transcript_150171:6-278(-)